MYRCLGNFNVEVKYNGHMYCMSKGKFIELIIKQKEAGKAIDNIYPYFYDAEEFKKFIDDCPQIVC